MIGRIGLARCGLSSSVVEIRRTNEVRDCAAVEKVGNQAEEVERELKD